MRTLLVIVSLLILGSRELPAQAFNEGTVAGSLNIGVPHLYKGIVKLATQSEKFKEAFDGKLEVSGFKGQYPVAIKGEWGIKKYLGIGLSASSWDISFNVKDNYNVLHAGQVTGTDETDIYNFKIRSTSIGIRPNLHIPLENDRHDIYLGLAVGFTKNKLTVDFSSTDVNKVYPNAKYDLSLPGFIYLGPSFGYRYYFSEWVGINMELGYEKGAILQGGLALRFNNSEKQDQ